MKVILRTKIPYQAILEAELIVEDKIVDEEYNWGPKGNIAHRLSNEFEPIDLNNLDAESFLEAPSQPGFNQGYLKTVDGKELIRMGWKTDMNDFITINYVKPEHGSSPDTMVDMFIAYSGRRRYFLNECEELADTLVSRALAVIGITMYVRPNPTDGSATLEFRYGTGIGNYQNVKAPYEYVTSNKDMHWWESQLSYLERLGSSAKSTYIADNFENITVGTLLAVSREKVNCSQLTFSSILLDLFNQSGHAKDIVDISEALEVYCEKLK